MKSITRQRVYEIIAEQLGVEKAAVTASTRFADLSAGALDVWEIVQFVLEECGLDMWENIEDVQGLITFVRNFRCEVVD